jgi:hypothetical protein
MCCDWCAGPVETGGRGSAKRFCSSACRAAFHRAARRWALGELAAGRVTVAQLRAVPGESVYACSRGLAGSGGTEVAAHPLTLLDAKDSAAFRGSFCMITVGTKDQGPQPRAGRPLTYCRE